MEARRSTRTLALMVLLVACGDGGPEPGKPLASTEPIEPGDTCPDGGVVVRWGIDDDGDGVLSGHEIDGSEVRCDPPAPGSPDVLTRQDAVAGGGACPYGGTAIHSGPDVDGDGMLDDDEIESTEYVCTDTLPVVRTRVERVEAGEECPRGGTVVHSGLDLDLDGTLDDEEITASSWFCDGDEPVADVEVSTTSGTSCARKANGTVWCWGDNLLGQLGLPLGSHAYGRVPIAVANAVQISGGYAHTCALDVGGSVWCWGDNGNGELGDDGPYGPVRRVEGIPPMRSVHALASATCSVDLVGDVWCWGWNGSGLSGGTPDDERLPPTRIEGVGRIVQLSGWGQVCGVDEDGALWCWGHNLNAEIVAPASDPLPVTRIEGLPPVASVSAGSGNTCIVDVEGGITCWGGNFYWKLGDSDPDPSPRQILGLGPATSVSIGWFSTCAALVDGSAACWGSNAYGAFGDGTVSRRSAEPVPVQGLFGIEKLAHSHLHVCAVSDGRTHCWGNNDRGQSVGVLTLRPAQVLGGAAKVAAGMHGTCAIRTDRSPWCWGSFAYANFDGTWLLEPTRLASWNDAIDVASGSQHACFARADETVWCWGANGNGQLGDGTDTTRTELVLSQVGGARAVAAGGNYTCAIQTDGRLWCWGFVGFSLGTWSEPTELLAGAQEVSIGFAHACALDDDRRVHCWGDNESGQVGDGTFSRRERPVAVFTDAISVTAGDRNTCALRADGTRWCWGEWLGRTPVEVDAPGLDARMSRGLGADCLASAGSLLCRGSNLWGQIGDGTVEYRTDYVTVDVEDVIDVTQQWTHTCALDAQGGVWCWGDNADAQIGDGSPPGMVVRPTIAP